MKPCNHEPGMTPLGGFIICKFCGINLQPLQSQSDAHQASILSQPRPGHIINFNVGAVNIPMCYVPPGKFSIRYHGEECEREIAKGFYISQMPVTEALWFAIQFGPAVSPNNSAAITPKRRVSYQECLDFIKMLQQKLPALNLSLPTEVQWAYAHCAGATDIIYYGFGIQCMDPIQSTNAWNLQIFAGGFQEWCTDRDKKGYYQHNEHMITRGSLLLDPRPYTSYRKSRCKNDRSPYVGFRVIHTP